MSFKDANFSSKFVVHEWATSDGLPVNEIEDLKETPDGFLWLGTQQGLVRFDGVRFESFFDVPTGQQFGTRVSPLEIDARGQLWFVPDEVGIMRRDGGVRFTEFLTNKTVLPRRIVSLLSDGANALHWVDMRGGLGRILIDDPENPEVIQAESVSGASRWVRDYSGAMWLTDQYNLRIYQAGQWKNVAVTGSGTTFVVAPRREGGMWVAREARLRMVMTDGTNQEVASAPWAGQSRVTCLHEDRRGRLWIGTLGQGLFCYTGGQFYRVVQDASIISCILEDGQDNIWAGTRGSGLIRVRERRFYVHDLSSGLKNEFVRSLAQDRNGRLWLTTVDGGLGWFQNGTWHELTRAEGWRKYDSLSVLPRADGSVWISTIHRGMWRWQDNQLSKVELGTNAPTEPAVDLREDSRGRLWAVTDNSGVYCLEGDRLVSYSESDGLPSARIRTLIEDDAGDIWAGDWEGGVARFRSDKWELVRKPTGPLDAVQCIIAEEGVLWIGTSHNGLLRLKNGKTFRVGKEQGLPDLSIRQLLMDGHGSIWACSPHKLLRISRSQLDELVEGRRRKIEVITYGSSDGLPDISFGNWWDPRCWRTSDGELWFAAANGAIHFHPTNLPTSRPPPILVEQTLLDGKPVEATALQNLRPGAGRLELRFTAPCLSAPERVHFRYQLSGVDSDWVDVGPERSANYASIPPGKHQFRVQASSPEGVWNPKAAIIDISVHPYFWQRSWFIAVAAGVITGGGVWSFRRATVRKLNRRLRQLSQQQALDRERTRIAQDIHDELGANLTSIGLLADMGIRHKMDSFMVARGFRQICETARESVAAMDAIVWTLNPRNDSLDHFANYISQFTRDFFRPTQTRTRLDLPPHLPTHPMSTETRHQLFLVVKESFNNIVRHAEASEVNIQLSCDEKEIRLVIADDGKGLPVGENNGNGEGLRNLHERMDRLGGACRISSENGSGTTLEFVLPLSKLN